MSQEEFQPEPQDASPEPASRRRSLAAAKRGPAKPDPANGLEVSPPEQVHREEVAGRGSGETAGGSPENAEGDNRAASRPLALPGVSNNIPFSNTRTIGGEDWLELSLYLRHRDFPRWKEAWDQAREAAEAGDHQNAQVLFGDMLFVMQPGAARTGSGNRRIAYRWHLQSATGWTLLLMQRSAPHATLPNGIARAKSLPLMRRGVRSYLDELHHALEAASIDLVQEKVSRVDATIDLPDTAVALLQEPFQQGHFVTRGRYSSDHLVEIQLESHCAGKERTGFAVGKRPCHLIVYDKARAVRNDSEKLSLMQWRRWGGMGDTAATRVEFQLGRAKLKDFGVDSYSDWQRLRGTIVHQLTHNWFRLTDGPIDRHHPDRTPVHPMWIAVQKDFATCYGPKKDISLVPLETIPITCDQLLKQSIGTLASMLARERAPVDSNESFVHEAWSRILDGIEDRNMAEEISRRVLELGNGPRNQP